MNAAAADTVAALQMYDWPEVRLANDALWAFLSAQLAAGGIPSPARLDRRSNYAGVWSLPELLMAQTCGYPYATGLRDRVRLVGTPCYDVPGCRGADYSSVIIAGRHSTITSLAELGDAVAAVNSVSSQSGHWAMREAIAEAKNGVAPRAVVLSGGHRQSLRMVAAGAADVAAIDAVCWALAARHEPSVVAAVKVIGRSPFAPGLPIITARTTSDHVVAALSAAWSAAITAPELADTRCDLFLAGFKQPPEPDYDRIMDLRRSALEVRFPAVPN